MDLQVSVLWPPSPPLQGSRVVFPSPCLASFTPRVLLICRLLITAVLRFSPRRSASSCPPLFFFIPHPSFFFSPLTCPRLLLLLHSHPPSLHPFGPPPPSPPHLCPVKVEPSVPRPRRRPLPFCPCCSPAEGNVTEPPLLQVCWRRPFDLWNPADSPPPLTFSPCPPPPLPVFSRVCACVCD